MSAINVYLIRAASPNELHAALVAASTGKARPFAGDEDHFDEARVRFPYPETVPGEPDPETGAPTKVLTGGWLCEVVLVDEVDAALALIAQDIATDTQAASG